MQSTFPNLLEDENSAIFVILGPDFSFSIKKNMVKYISDEGA